MSQESCREICSYLKSLRKTFSVRAEVSRDFIREVFQQFSGKKPENAIIPIKNQMGLKNKFFKVTFFDDQLFLENYPCGRGKMPDWSQRRFFMEMPLLVSPFYNTQEKLASIDLTNVPFCETKAFDERVIRLSIGKSVFFQPVQYFMQVISHELSHLLLHGVRHPLYKSETATDLLSMIFGYNGIVFRNHNCLGYLNAKQTFLAHSLIKIEQQFKRLKRSF